MVISKLILYLQAIKYEILVDIFIYVSINKLLVLAKKKDFLFAAENAEIVRSISKTLKLNLVTRKSAL